MKKIFFILILGLSTIIFAKDKNVYEVVPIQQETQGIKVVRMLEGEFTGLYGVINSKGEFIAKPDKFIVSVQKNHIYLVDINYNEGLMALDGRWIAQMGKYKYKETYSNMYKKQEDSIARELFIVYLREDNRAKYGYINCSGELKIPMIYEEANNFSEGLAGVKLNDKWGFIDKDGNIKIGFNYDEVNNFKDGIALVRVNEKYFYVDKYGNKKVIKSLFRNLKEGIENLGHHIGESFEGKLRIKAKTN